MYDIHARGKSIFFVKSIEMFPNAYIILKASLHGDCIISKFTCCYKNSNIMKQLAH